MNSSSHRIWIGSRGWSKPAMRRDQQEAEERHVGRDQEDQALLDVVDDAPALAQAVHERGERVVAEHEVGGLPRDGRPAAHRDGDVGGVQGRGVVHAVAGHGDGPAGCARDLDDPALLVGRRPGDDRQGRQARARELARRPRSRARSR